MKRGRMSRLRIPLVVERVNDIYFIPGKTHVEAGEQEKGQDIKAAEDAKTQNGCMPLPPASAWAKLTNANVAWSTRWTVKGLLPVCPHLVLTANVDFASWTWVQPLVLC